MGVRVEAAHGGDGVGSVWIPLSARLTPANTADNEVAAVLMEALPGRHGSCLEILTTMTTS